MNNADAKYNWLGAPQAWVSLKVGHMNADVEADSSQNQSDRVVCVRECTQDLTLFPQRVRARGPAVRVQLPRPELVHGLPRGHRPGPSRDFVNSADRSQPGEYKIVLCSDDLQFGGHGRVDHSTRFFTVSRSIRAA